ncbi:MAG: P-type conjugative transfer protein TrbG, partial [Acetobacter sp.]|nr:P-type conjugative transfer protein TrbG [Acetobacter sp.]
ISKREQWTHSVAVSPFIGAKGSVKFVFGAQDPTIMCAVRQVCDVALQAGEQLNSISVGDPTRWAIVPAITGSGTNAIEHLIIKPLVSGSETSMVVTTDRRTYHFLLQSSDTDFMPYVSFAYPEDIQARLAALKAKEQKERQDRTIPETGEYLGNLNFNYCIKGKASFKPVRVYDDGVKTLIDLPPSVPVTDMPSLLVKSPFTKTPGLVNIRLQNNNLIVDKTFNEAVLIAGVGSHQQKIKIYRGGCH